MRPWIQNFLTEKTDVTTASVMAIDWQQNELDEGHLRHHVYVTSHDESDPEAFLAMKMRIIAYYLVDQIPRVGLRDLLESLRDIFEYYETRNHAAVPEKITSSSVVLDPEVNSYVRPEFHISEE